MESLEHAPRRRRRILMGQLLPKFEGPTVSTSIRMPKGMREELATISKVTSHGVSDVTIYFLRWAIQQWHVEQEQRTEEKKVRK